LPTEAGGAGRPGPHPDPPPDLHQRELPLVRSRGPWWRVHRRGRAPIFFGRTGLGRFDDPERAFGVLYAATDFSGAFIETFGWHTGRNLIGLTELEERELSRIESASHLSLVDLTGKGLAWIGADGRLLTGEHTVAQRWSAALFAHPTQPDGILYRARHDPERVAVAIHDRAEAKELAPQPLGSLSDPRNANLLREALDRYRFGL
jgi:RES domain